MAAADLNAIRATIEGRLATELATALCCRLCSTTWLMSQRRISSWVQCLTAFGANEYLGHGLTLAATTGLSA